MKASQCGDNTQKISLNSPEILGTFLLEVETGPFLFWHLASCPADSKTKTNKQMQHTQEKGTIHIFPVFLKISPSR